MAVTRVAVVWGLGWVAATFLLTACVCPTHQPGSRNSLANWDPSADPYGVPWEAFPEPVPFRDPRAFTRDASRDPSRGRYRAPGGDKALVLTNDGLYTLQLFGSTVEQGIWAEGARGPVLTPMMWERTGQPRDVWFLHRSGSCWAGRGTTWTRD